MEQVLNKEVAKPIKVNEKALFKVKMDFRSYLVSDLREKDQMFIIDKLKAIFYKSGICEYVKFDLTMLYIKVVRKAINLESAIQSILFEIHQCIPDIQLININTYQKTD